MNQDPTLVFAALADPTRRAIFERLVGTGEQNVRALTAFAGVAQPTVSKHLRVLRTAGLVIDRSQGREMHYRPAPRGMASLVDWFSHYGGFWADHFDRLETLLDRMDN